jgi:Uma2 family endonuclease
LRVDLGGCAHRLSIWRLRLVGPGEGVTPGPYTFPMAKAGVSQLTYADLQALPDDHKRYELIDGELVVSASPNLAHQRAVLRLAMLLHAACSPALLEVVAAPFDWLVDDHNVFVPDLLVARTGELTERNLPRPPVLAVEVLSPSTRARDLVRKRAAYQRAGLPHYWVVDPLAPSVTVLDALDGVYAATATAYGDEPLTVKTPFPVTVVPADLVR